MTRHHVFRGSESHPPCVICSMFKTFDDLPYELIILVLEYLRIKHELFIQDVKVIEDLSMRLISKRFQEPVARNVKLVVTVKAESNEKFVGISFPFGTRIISKYDFFNNKRNNAFRFWLSRTCNLTFWHKYDLDPELVASIVEFILHCVENENVPPPKKITLDVGMIHIRNQSDFEFFLHYIDCVNKYNFDLSTDLRVRFKGEEKKRKISFRKEYQNILLKDSYAVEIK